MKQNNKNTNIRMCQTTTRLSKHVACGGPSKSLSVASQSLPTSSGWFLQLLSVSSCSLLAGLLLSSSGLFEWFGHLDIQSQFRVVAVFVSCALLYAAAVRELCQDRLAQWSGRIAGLAGVLFLMVFAWHSSAMCGTVQMRDHVERHYSEQQVVTRDQR